MLTVESRFYDRVLSYNAAIIFELHVQFVIRQNTFAKFQNLGESIGAKPVFRVAPDMCLQQHLFFLTSLTAAIDELSYHVTDFGYVGVRRDIVPIGQDKTRKRRRMLTEEISQSAQLHPKTICLLRNIVKRLFASRCNAAITSRG